MSLMIFGMGSITNAMRGKQLLQQQGIRAYIQRKQEVTNGCGYRLAVYDRGEEAKQVLEHNKLRITRVIRDGDEG
ncbi:MAG: DUF3343 domain-containing protein [Ruminococcaceae bacterium]|nr:DUF3343 domain-containing protein [Oscillospiraceae bacterium]